MKRQIAKKIVAIISIIVLVVLAIFGIVGLIMANIKTPSTLLTKTVYHYPYVEVVKVEEDGKIYKSKIVDELTADGAPQDDFVYIKTMPNNELEEITSIINQMKAEEKKNEDFSESYGIAVNLGDGELHGCEYFAQEEVDKLNSIIENYE